MRTQENYLHLLISLLPTGKCWPKLDIVTKLTEMLNVFAAELLQVESRIDALVKAFLLLSEELIDRWENVVGLPDSCTGPLGTLQERINAVIAKLAIIGKGNLREQFYIDQAAALGYTITITVLSANNWRVNGSIETITFFRVGVSSVGDPLQSSDNDKLECAINKTKPAHTIVTFNYT